jgi:hypothetical protein
MILTALKQVFYKMQSDGYRKTSRCVDQYFGFVIAAAGYTRAFSVVFQITNPWIYGQGTEIVKP